MIMLPKMRQVKWLSFLLLLVLTSFGLDAQKKKPVSSTIPQKEVPSVNFPESSFNALSWRSIGPFRGGRSAAVSGVVGKPNLYYFGSTGGGVWKTQDAGQTWENISDKYFGGSVGSIAVSESDPNVIYVGGGEVTVRGNVLMVMVCGNVPMPEKPGKWPDCLSQNTYQELESILKIQI